MAKLVLNIERIGWSKLEGQRRHDLRIGGDLSHVDLAATRENLVLKGSGDPKYDVQQIMERYQARPRADNEKPFNRFVLQPGDGFDWSDTRAITDWLKSSVDWLTGEYGDGFAYAMLHTDERVPHIHAVCVPLYRSKTKHRTVWKVSHKQHPATRGQGSYERLRRRCAAALGFEYGEPGNKPRTELQRLADEAAKDEAARVLAAAQSEAMRVIQRAQNKAHDLMADLRCKAAVITKELMHAEKVAKLVKQDAKVAMVQGHKKKLAPHLSHQRGRARRVRDHTRD